ncbi:hypothetical protein [Saccharothrix yanglingensis]|uniref:hypothetical protein n=1 Tax=Saccharothrix yanglingensis TaxID=659496 RepID=UPI0027D2543C|nr:hypothetical protein [Saccharothrix yanglingensis]
MRNKAFLVAPVLVLVYGIFRVFDGFDGERGPGIAWTAGHLAFMGALVAFAVVFRRLRAMAGTTLATVTAVVATAGAAALFGQFAVDVVVGLLNDDHAGMAAMSRQVKAVPGVGPLFYDLGPYLFYVGQLVLVVQVALAGRAKAWTPFLVLADLAMPFVDKDLIPVGALLLLVSFRQFTRPERPAPRWRTRDGAAV